MSDRDEFVVVERRTRPLSIAVSPTRDHGIARERDRDRDRALDYEDIVYTTTTTGGAAHLHPHHTHHHSHHHHHHQPHRDSRHDSRRTSRRDFDFNDAYADAAADADDYEDSSGVVVVRAPAPPAPDVEIVEVPAHAPAPRDRDRERGLELEVDEPLPVGRFARTRSPLEVVRVGRGAEGEVADGAVVRRKSRRRSVRGRRRSLDLGDGRRPEFKRLIVACDGTWLNSDNGMANGELAIPSNVTRISRAIRPISKDGIPQIVYYHFGVGSRGNVINRVVGGTTGGGMEENIREAYSFLSTNYTPGDEIFLVGFSRGAFTARSVAGLISEVGVLTSRGLGSLPAIYEDVQHRRDPRYRDKNPDCPFPNKPSAADPRYREELERRGMTHLGVTVKAIGVWDTVGSLGTPRIGWLTRVGIQPMQSSEMKFYDTKLTNCIENAFQALALDEKRAAFSPAVWEKPRGNTTVLRQVWFPGVHGNVGGGYDDQQLANITLAWMVSQLEPFLDFRLKYVMDQDEQNERYYKKHHQPVRPWSFGEIPNSSMGVYMLGGSTTRTPGQYCAVDPHSGRSTGRPLRDTHEYMHPSVRTRLRLGGPGEQDKGRYDPEALDDWRLVVEYPDDLPEGADGPPRVYWKLKGSSSDDGSGGARIIPESPLWRLERELCDRDPETFDYVMWPPRTKVRERRRRERSPSRGRTGRVRSEYRRSMP